MSENRLVQRQGTIYPALGRLEQRGWIRSEWRKSETNRRTKFYFLSRVGRKGIEDETGHWGRMAATMARFRAPSD
ncbi:MAG TPA: helix-turn-helix transcriptional regulator [Terracidiphilus sp.]